MKILVIFQLPHPLCLSLNTAFEISPQPTAHSNIYVVVVTAAAVAVIFFSIAECHSQTATITNNIRCCHAEKRSIVYTRDEHKTSFGTHQQAQPNR